MNVATEDGSGKRFVDGPFLHGLCQTAPEESELDCKPLAISAADLNADGISDLAVLIAASAFGAPEAVEGLVHVYLGLGDGTFRFSNKLSVGSAPRLMATGRFSGGLANDLVVTTVARDGVAALRVVRGMRPAPREDQSAEPTVDVGGACTRDEQCELGICVGGFCGVARGCPAASRCDVRGYEGVCQAPLPRGMPCSHGRDCDTGHCADGFCCSHDACGTGAACNVGGREGICWPIQ
jgi:hypothetical protein